ncbi:ABC transporter ATP-binding protein [Halomonas beimenensis]
MAFAEVTAVVAFGPFMALVGDIERLDTSSPLVRVYTELGFEDPLNFLFWMGLAVLGVLVLASFISMYTVWRLSVYGQQVGAEIGMRLYQHYMGKPWLFHAQGSSAHLTSKISQECTRITEKVIAPLMKMNARVVMAVFMIGAVFLYNPAVAATGVLFFILAYVFLYMTVRRRLTRYGVSISRTQSERFKLMAEGFGGVKDVLVLGRQPVFNGRFATASRTLGRARGVSKALSEVPRYAMELIAFTSVIFLLIYLLNTYDGDLGKILPLISIYALAGIKLLPAFQQIYACISTIKSNLSAFDAIREDLLESRHAEPEVQEDDRLHECLVPKASISLQDVTFHYPGDRLPVVEGISLSVPANTVVGIVGPSGAGKSTLIDILLGLIVPDEGVVRIDDVPLTDENRRSWQNCLGFVSQSIFLADASIRENIAFGLPQDEIDHERVERAAEMAHLGSLLSQLRDGLDTRVGERGIQLSGGQRQRIGIARALYDDAKVLILDEATSALDGITEQGVMESIHEFNGRKTIVMIAHRLTTVKRCDVIYVIEDGHVSDWGSYDELSRRNLIFQRMAHHG